MLIELSHIGKGGLSFKESIFGYSFVLLKFQFVLLRLKNEDLVGLASGFVPWGTLSTLEEGLGALNTIGSAALQMANMRSVKRGSLGVYPYFAIDTTSGIEKETLEFLRVLAEYQNSASEGDKTSSAHANP
uniref:Uncharacterized protein n=1 Tax=Tanacetum cinerariifolium TaxID=118510 RepID=A0A6L2JNF0_TANCI|nr:hypothetical protein [Tanacetum cinerariifolium]